MINFVQQSALRQKIKAVMFGLALLFGMFSFSVPSEAKIYMFDSKNCYGCKIFKRDFGSNYYTRIRVNSKAEKRIRRKLKGAIFHTPTFVRIKGGKEVGHRIKGYPGHIKSKKRRKAVFLKQIRRLKRQ